MLKSNIGARRGTNGGLRMIVGDLRARAGRSLADALAEALREAVRDGRLPAGTPLPASRTLAADLQVSRGVVVRAYEQLVAEGYLRAHVGRGTVVGELPGVTAPAVPSTDRVLPASPGLPALG
ncbi:MAG TPA: winged helix-turn-helix domain-containing protein, partial [Egibacteraceae bacterium]